MCDSEFWLYRLFRVPRVSGLGAVGAGTSHFYASPTCTAVLSTSRLPRKLIERLSYTNPFRAMGHAGCNNVLQYCILYTAVAYD